ncbi:MAG: hypothetical protein JO288_12200, partial [Hyphomicrobiales bacterium]|nr:hypothetical protein [Hyphomicrobiales bacterium]
MARRFGRVEQPGDYAAFKFQPLPRRSHDGQLKQCVFPSQRPQDCHRGDEAKPPDDLPAGWAGEGGWDGLHALFRSIISQIPRSRTLTELEPVADELSRLADRVLDLLETHVKTSNSRANESQNERHIQNSNPKPKIELEPASEAEAAPPAPQAPTPKAAETVFPLGMVLDACPDIGDY